MISERQNVQDVFFAVENIINDINAVFLLGLSYITANTMRNGLLTGYGGKIPNFANILPIST